MWTQQQVLPLFSSFIILYTYHAYGHPGRLCPTEGMYANYSYVYVYI